MKHAKAIGILYLIFVCSARRTAATPIVPAASLIQERQSHAHASDSLKEKTFLHKVTPYVIGSGVIAFLISPATSKRHVVTSIKSFLEHRLELASPLVGPIERENYFINQVTSLPSAHAALINNLPKYHQSLTEQIRNKIRHCCHIRSWEEQVKASMEELLQTYESDADAQEYPPETRKLFMQSAVGEAATALVVLLNGYSVEQITAEPFILKQAEEGVTKVAMGGTTEIGSQFAHNPNSAPPPQALRELAYLVGIRLVFGEEAFLPEPESGLPSAALRHLVNPTTVVEDSHPEAKQTANKTLQKTIIEITQFLKDNQCDLVKLSRLLLTRGILQREDIARFIAEETSLSGFCASNDAAPLVNAAHAKQWARAVLQGED